MSVLVTRLLSGGDLAFVASEPGRSDAVWADGRTTAHLTAVNVKSNQQGRFVDPSAELLVFEALKQNPDLVSFAMPHRLSKPMVNRYQASDYYGPHVDSPVMGQAVQIRVDLSVSLFLSEPTTYEGGGLKVGGTTYRPPAGWAVIFDATHEHEVEPIVSGVRHAVIVWIQSFVRDAARREVLRAVSAASRAAPANLDLSRAVNNLLRMWVEI